jgi:hypothetical protein
MIEKNRDPRVQWLVAQEMYERARGTIDDALKMRRGAALARARLAQERLGGERHRCVAG